MNFTCFLLLLKNMSTRRFKMIYMTCIIFLLDNTILGFYFYFLLLLLLMFLVNKLLQYILPLPLRISPVLFNPHSHSLWDSHAFLSCSRAVGSHNNWCLIICYSLGFLFDILRTVILWNTWDVCNNNPSSPPSPTTKTAEIGIQLSTISVLPHLSLQIVFSISIFRREILCSEKSCAPGYKADK